MIHKLTCLTDGLGGKTGVTGGGKRGKEGTKDGKGSGTEGNNIVFDVILLFIILRLYTFNTFHISTHSI